MEEDLKIFNIENMITKGLKILFAVLITVFWALNSYAQNPVETMRDSLLMYNKLLSEKQVREDLELLFSIQKEVNSGLYVYHNKQQVDSIYNEAFQSIKQPMRIIDFFKIMLRLADYEGSVHNYTAANLDLVNFINRQKAFFPYSLIYINGQIIFDGQSSSIPAGSRITCINGVSDTGLMESFYKYYPSDGYNMTYKLSASVDKSFGINYLLEYGLYDEFNVEYISPKSEAIETVTLPAVTMAEREKNIKNKFSASVSDLLDFKTQPPYSFHMIDSSMGLLNLRWFGMVSGLEDPGFEPYVNFLDSVFTALDDNNISNLIIDIRNNPGGSDPTFEQPVMYLTNKSFKENVEAEIIFDPNLIPYKELFWGVSTLERMDNVSIGLGIQHLKDRFPVFSNKISLQNQKYNPVYRSKSPIFKGNLYLLINENVASAASHFASLVKGYVQNVTIVGVETAGGYYVHNGHTPLVYELPNSKIKTQFSIVHVVQDAPKMDDQPDGQGILPDYEVWPTLEDYMKQKDTQMEFVMKLVGGYKPEQSNSRN